MIRLAFVGAVLLASVAGACGSEADEETTRYEVTVLFDTSVTQDDLDEVETVLRSYDEDMEYVIQESFPPIGRAFLTSDAADFCSTIEAELEAKPYVREVQCEEQKESPQSSNPDQPVTSD